MLIRLRRHHILCSLGFEGEGYSDAFVANMGNIVNQHLRADGGEATMILITDSADAICAPCPRRRDAGCEKGQFIEDLDSRHGAQLGVSPDDRLTWGECLDRVAAHVVPDDLDTLCEGCKWLPFGMCKSAVARLDETKRGRPKATP
ncbi:DUF1284 domain-containing protein [Jannaschia sp. 2305UL9-9]|uniref:DUF1284 domain-containing protein n=1 Tax=Jannaschia sp. 2305UL9-9 TaxID=3121638 RepID=UPI003527682E